MILVGQSLAQERLEDGLNIQHARLRSMLLDLEKPIERIDEKVLEIEDKLEGLYNFTK
jgi:hypothetical protein